MLLSITTTHRPATDLGYLLHKNPARLQTFELSCGRAHVFYPEADTERCTACLLIEVDPVGIVRGRARSGGPLDQYVNDRPYAASSFMSVAIARVLGTALGCQSKERPELAASPIPLVAQIDVLPVRGGETFLREVFEPLGYQVEAVRHPLDPEFPEWGESPYYRVTLTAETTLALLLNHLYVLIPVFDHHKHYYVGFDEVDKLVDKGEGWLAAHPKRDAIVNRYLKSQPSLARQAIAQLLADESPEEAEAESEIAPADEPPAVRSRNEQRLAAVAAALKASGARRVIDLGCGEGRLLRELLGDRQFDEIVGFDVSSRSLAIAERRLRLDSLPPKQRERIRLLHGSLVYRDKRLAGFEAAAIVEVVEHLDPPRLAAFERVIFEFARPSVVVLTTPNREYNVVWESLPAGAYRHGDHRFEWTREEFRDWAGRVATRFGYVVGYAPIGPEDPTHGPPTQMAIFSLATAPAAEIAG